MSSMAYVSKQPTASIMDPQLGEKTADCCLNHQSCTTGNGHCPHRKCHRSRFRRFILPITLILLILVAGLFALSCLQDSHFSDWGVDGLLPRAFGNDNTNGGSFTNHKLYLVVVFGGLLVLFVLGVLLSFWCCRESFENPLCCPCYLCACCGGIACLECIGCTICVGAAVEGTGP